MVLRCKKCHRYDCVIIEEIEGIEWVKDRRKKSYGYRFQKVKLKCPFCKHIFITRVMYYPEFRENKMEVRKKNV